MIMASDPKILVLAWFVAIKSTFLPDQIVIIEKIKTSKTKLKSNQSD